MLFQYLSLEGALATGEHMGGWVSAWVADCYLGFLPETGENPTSPLGDRWSKAQITKFNQSALTHYPISNYPKLTN